MAKAYTPFTSNVPAYTPPIDLAKGNVYIKRFVLFFTRSVAVLPAIATINAITDTHVIIRKIRLFHYGPFDAIHRIQVEVREGIDANGVMIDEAFLSDQNREVLLDNIDIELYNLFLRAYRGDVSGTTPNISVTVYYELV
jgi:hypothetical protein